MKHLYKSISLFFLFLNFHSNLYAQVPTVQDCLGAIPLCQSTIIQNNAFSGTGNYPNEITYPLSCLQSGEKNDVWYIFTVQNTGVLNFSITPIDPQNDYDWAVFNLTDSPCSAIATAPLQVSCNYAGNNGNSGITGANGGANQQSSPTFTVTAGSTFVLNISNYSATQSGYTLDFSASTAQLFDTASPYIDSTTTVLAMGDTTFSVIFSENVYCSSVQKTDFTFTGSGGPYTLTSVLSPACSLGADYSNEYVLVFSPPISTSGPFIFSMVDTVLDLCNNPPVLPVNISIMSCATFATMNPVACISYLSPSTHYTWTASGTYMDTIPNNSGCDSVLTIQLTIHSVDTGITQNGSIITAAASGASYQWLDCDNGYAPISGETNQVFAATANGHYAVAITQNNCTDTSACYAVTGVSVNEIISGNHFEIFPNPAQSEVVITFKNHNKIPRVTILDLVGKVYRVFCQNNSDCAKTERIEFNIKDFPEGIYFVQIHDPVFIETKKLIVVK